MFSKFGGAGFRKYNAKRTEIDGIKFASRSEAARYLELKELEKYGKIIGLELQPRFELLPSFRMNGEAIRKTEYVGDFRYTATDGETVWTVVEDVKGMKTEAYKLKKKFFLYKFGNNVQFKEVRPSSKTLRLITKP